LLDKDSHKKFAVGFAKIIWGSDYNSKHVNVNFVIAFYHTYLILNSINKIFTLTRILNTDMNFVLSVKIIINKLIIQIHGLSRRNLFLLS
jgi:hypothetical protein